MRMARLINPVFAVTLSMLCLEPMALAQYTVERAGTGMRGNLWIGDGLAGVYSSNVSAGDRFRVGGELQFGDDYQFILGATLFDRIWSNENSASVGHISRESTDFNFGYFLVPDRLWLMYSLQLEDVSGNAVIGSVTVIGHQLSIGYRFYENGQFNMALEAAYLFNPSDSASTFNYMTNASGTASFPPANIWSLNLRLGLDIGA